ncbi:nuclear pore glycoprotein p62-like [Amblyomma americanum]
MNYRLLEESVKEWEEERAGLETNFVKQATQVNASDQLLWASAKRVAQLNSLVERAQLDQQQLEHEVDYEAAQLAELERLLEPLESAMRTAPTRTMRQHADLERDYTYRLADNINSQLNCVSRDILDIVEHFNAANASSAQDKALEMISKVLSSHMDALKWIKHNSDLLQQKLQDLERFGQEQRTDSLLKR